MTNLIATDTREGEVLAVLLQNFVTAANRLDGCMFDSLSVVGELVGIPEERLRVLLAARYGDDELEAQAAIDIVRELTAARLEESARRAERQEAELASSVDVAQAVSAYHEDQLERINPAIVERYINWLAAAGVLRVKMLAAAESGILLLARADGTPLPPEFGAVHEFERSGPLQARVATSGDAIASASAASSDTTGAIHLGPSDPAYHALVILASEHLSPHMWRGGTLVDETSTTDYDLYCFRGKMVEGGDRRTTPWSTLIRVDAAGARPIRWEALANLRPSDDAGSALHAGHASDAELCAHGTAQVEETRRHQALAAWLRLAQRELRRLPAELVAGIAEKGTRVEKRAQLDAATQARLDDLRKMAQIQIGELERIALSRRRGFPGAPSQPCRRTVVSGMVTFVKSHARYPFILCI